MAQPVQLIFTDNPGALPATYTLPPSLDLDLATIRAKIDGAGASGSFLPCLSVYSQDGKLMARVPLDTTYATGDTGEGTWAPFLRTAATSTPPPPGSAIQYARFQRKSTTDITVPSGVPTQVAGTAGSSVNTDSSIFQVNTNDEIEMLVDGVVGLWAHTVWSVYTASFRAAFAFDVTPFPDVMLASGGIALDNFDELAFGGIARVSAGAVLRLYVSQKSGANQTLYGGGASADDTNYLEVSYLGAPGP